VLKKPIKRDEFLPEEVSNNVNDHTDGALRMFDIRKIQLSSFV